MFNKIIAGGKFQRSFLNTLSNRGRCGCDSQSPSHVSPPCIVQRGPLSRGAGWYHCDSPAAAAADLYIYFQISHDIFLYNWQFSLAQVGQEINHLRKLTYCYGALLKIDRPMNIDCDLADFATFLERLPRTDHRPSCKCNKFERAKMDGFGRVELSMNSKYGGR